MSSFVQIELNVWYEIAGAPFTNFNPRMSK